MGASAAGPSTAHGPEGSLRLLLTPVFGHGDPGSEVHRLVRLHGLCSPPGCVLVDDPRDADAILLTDAGNCVNGGRKFNPALLRLLTHPYVRRFRDRCFLYNELDRPRPYLPGVYAYMPWFPGVERVASAIAPTGALHERRNPEVTGIASGVDRDLLFSFMGRDCHPVRTAILQARFGRDDVVVTDTSSRYDHYGAEPDPEMRRAYARVMGRSRWALCPRGASSGSLRVFEAMRMGVAPVVLSDDWYRPAGPDWDSFSLWLPEASVHELPDLLLAQGDRWRTMGEAARKAYETYFSEHGVFGHLLLALDALRRFRAAESRWMVLRRQSRELAWQLVGLPSPTLGRSRRNGVVAHEGSRTRPAAG